MPFSTRITIAFGDTDPAGFVYYPNLFHYCHIALERFFAEQCGTPYHLLLSESRIGFPTVKIDAEFLKPIVYGDEIEVSVTVVKVSRHSITLSYRLRRVSDGVRCAQASMVHVAMQLDSRKAIEIPSDLRIFMESSLAHL